MTIERHHTALWFGICDLAETAVTLPSKDAGGRIKSAIRETPKNHRPWIVKAFREQCARFKRYKQQRRTP